jgi:hypothetical protein
MSGCYECAWGKVAGCWRCGSARRIEGGSPSTEGAGPKGEEPGAEGTRPDESKPDQETVRAGLQQQQAEDAARWIKALRDIESACIHSPHRALGVWDEGLAHLIHHHTRFLPPEPDAARHQQPGGGV